MTALTLYDYWRSSAAYRLRIAMNLKGIDYASTVINIAPGADEQFADGYKSLNPQMRVPMIEFDGKVSSQSMAILEWLEETYPEPSILPSDSWARLQARAFADTIACDIHPLNNLSVLAKLREAYGLESDVVGEWYRDWIVRGFTALEVTARDNRSHAFLFTSQPTVAEICLVPQLANARRFETDLSGFPRLVEIDDKCRKIDAFARAAPEAVKQS